MKMKRDKFNLVLLLLCFCTGSLSNPVPEKLNEVQIHKYTGHIDTTTSASDESLARWTISADLHRMYQEEDSEYIILKLENIKTSIFNGNRSDLHNAHEKDIPEEAKILEQEFALKWTANRSMTFNILFKPNEPLWSKNLKKGIASLMEFDYEKPELTSEGEIAPLKTPKFYTVENLIYGECDVEYTRKSASLEKGIVYEMKMDNLKCQPQAIKHLTKNARAPRNKDFFDILDYNQTKLLTIKLIDKHHHLEKLETKSSMSYKTSPSALYSQQVEQEHTFVFHEQHEYEKRIDVSEFGEDQEYTYEFGDDPTAGRHVYEKDSVKLTKRFFKQFEEFNKLFTYSPVDLDARDPRELIYELYDTLSNMDVEGFKSIEKAVADMEDFDEYIYLSMLSYIGTDASVKYLTNFYKDDAIQGIEEFSARMLITFPQYLEKPSDDKLVAMEGLINSPQSWKKISKHAAVFGFASAVANACTKDAISKKYRQKYIDMFHKKYVDGDSYEEKMVYVLGLVNMAECLDFDFMNSITTNSSELSELRSFALNGFKKYLVNHNENADKVYEIYWPLVQKKSEPFEVRVAALELLLSSPLSEEQFNTIVQSYVDDLNDPEDKQLANYLLTTLHSIQNTTGYYEPLGALASEAIKTANIRKFPKTYATGKYRLSVTDSVPNIGAAYEARFITDTKTNLVNTVEISFNHFGNSFDFGTYTLHLKLNGLLDNFFVRQYKWLNSDPPIPELLKLLKDNNFKVKDFIPDGHIDLVLLKNNAAVYARHWDTLESLDGPEIFNELAEFIMHSKYFNLVVSDYVHIPSDIGTPIIITNHMVDISKFDREQISKSFAYRSTWYYDTWIQSYNPLADAHIDNYKYYIVENSLKLNTTVHRKFPPSLTWINEKDSFTQVWDNNMGVTVEEEDKLKEYCATCPGDLEISRDNPDSDIHDWDIIGVNFDKLIYRHEENHRRGKVIEEFWTENLHQYNVDAFPYAGPFLFVANFFNYKFWLKSDLSKGSMRSRSINGIDEITETTLNTRNIGNNANSFGGQTITDLRTDITVKSLEEEVLSFINMTVIYDWYPIFVYENTTKQTGNRVTFFNFVYKSYEANSSLKICGNGDSDFPAIRDDRLSIKPYDDTVTKTVFKIDNNMDDLGECASPQYTYIFKEIYSTTDKKNKLNDQMSKDYEKCIADSKDLKYTAPTEECKRVSNKFTEYDNYVLHWTAVEHIEDHNETVQENKKLVEYSRVSEDKVRLSYTGLSDLLQVGIIQDAFSVEFYHPRMIANPLWMSYNKDETVNPEHAHSLCTITPSTIQKFNGKYVPNERKEWLAFGGCVNSSTFGLNGHTVDDKHVGFTFYSEKIVLVATFKNGHLDVTVNGQKITEEYQADDTFLIVNFLSQNVIYIQTFKLEIYYNTEYVFIRGESLFPRQVCGLCN